MHMGTTVEQPSLQLFTVTLQSSNHLDMSQFTTPGLPTASRKFGKREEAKEAWQQSHRGTGDGHVNAFEIRGLRCRADRRP